MDLESLYRIYQAFPSVQTDTRKLEPGCIYFALKGENFNGNHFAVQALERGAAYAVIDEPPAAPDPRLIYVDNALRTLQDLAARHRESLNIPVIAITGTNGKTTTKELVTAVLKTTYRTIATAGNLNNHIGVPLTLLRIPPETEMAVIEMGASHAGEIAGYCLIAQPTHAIITNCGKAHIEGFGSEEGVRRAKGELYDYIRRQQGVIFRDSSLTYLEEMAAGIRQQITYGRDHALYTGVPVERHLHLQLQLSGSLPHVTVKTELVGAYNFSNVMAAVAVGRHFKIPLPDIQQAIESYMPDNSRSQLIAAGSNRVILDAYNANPTSMKAAIHNFAALEDIPDKILWLGAMKEMGDDEAGEHEALVALIRQYQWTDVLLVGKEFQACSHPYKWFPDSSAAGEYIIKHLPSDSVILVKGSRSSRMEILVSSLLSRS